MSPSEIADSREYHGEFHGMNTPSPGAPKKGAPKKGASRKIFSDALERTPSALKNLKTENMENKILKKYIFFKCPNYLLFRNYKFTNLQNNCHFILNM